MRIHTTEVARILKKSGVGGFLTKPLDTDGKTGAVRWLRVQQGESDQQYMQRAIGLAEEQTECKGLAFATTGSLGIRTGEGTNGRRFKISGIPYGIVEQLKKLLDDAGFKAYEWAEQLRRGARPIWIAKVKPPPGGIDCFSLNVPWGEGTDAKNMHVEIEPWVCSPRHSVLPRSLINESRTNQMSQLRPALGNRMERARQPSHLQLRWLWMLGPSLKNQRMPSATNLLRRH